MLRVIRGVRRHPIRDRGYLHHDDGAFLLDDGGFLLL